MNEKDQEPVESGTEAPAEQPAAPKTVRVAEFDGDGLYQRLIEIPAEDLTDDHVAVPECDLPPGRYRWDRAAQCFVDAGPQEKRAEASPPALNALAWCLIALRDSGVALPRPCAEWLAYYKATVDFIGSDQGAAK